MANFFTSGLFLSFALSQFLTPALFASEGSAMKDTRASKRIPVADLLQRQGEGPRDNLLTCKDQDKGCRLRDGNLSKDEETIHLPYPALVSYRYTLECRAKSEKDLSLFAVKSSEQTRLLMYRTQGLKSNIYAGFGSKVELVLFGTREEVNAEIERQDCWRFTIDEVTILPIALGGDEESSL